MADLGECSYRAENTERRIFRALEAGKILGAADRARILDLIIFLIGKVVRSSGAERIIFMTYEAELPAKAMVKYRRVVQAVKECGYKVKTVDPYNGRRVWYADSE